MSRNLYFAYPGDLQTRTGGYGYDRRVIGALRDLDWDVHLVPLGEGFPNTPDLAAAEDALATIPEGSIVFIDGLAFGVMDDWAQRNALSVKIFALVHHPLALETGMPDDRRIEFAAREHRALSCTRGVVVTSPATARELQEKFAVGADKLVVATPGTDPVPLAIGGSGKPCILSVGSLTRRKGHDVLIEALAALKDLDWRCRIVGSRELDAVVPSELEEQISRLDLHERISLVGEVEDARVEFARADVFALASRYEGYGMVFAEALAHGLPIVGCAAGAVPDVVPPSAGVLVAPDDVAALSAALRRVLTEPETRTLMADASAVAGAALPSWRDTAATIAAFLERGA